MWLSEKGFSKAHSKAVHVWSCVITSQLDWILFLQFKMKKNMFDFGEISFVKVGKTHLQQCCRSKCKGGDCGTDVKPRSPHTCCMTVIRYHQLCVSGGQPSLRVFLIYNIFACFLVWQQHGIGGIWLTFVIASMLLIIALWQVMSVLVMLIVFYSGNEADFLNISKSPDASMSSLLEYLWMAFPSRWWHLITSTI